MVDRFRTLILILMALALIAAPAIADSKTTSSKGYSLPRSAATPSTPVRPAAPPPAASTTTAPPAATTTTPRSSNGYGLPGAAASAPGATRAPLSGSDAALARSNSGNALRNYSAQQERARYARSSVPVAAPSPGFSRYSYHYHSTDEWYAARSSWYGGYGWAPPFYVYSSAPHFGMWDALWFWFMLDTISDASHALWFHNHYDDPGYNQWRQEANRLAADNADLRAKLADLDARTQALESQPRDPTYMPPGAEPSLALAQENAVAPTPSGGHNGMIMLVGGMVVVGAGIMMMRTRRFI